MTTKITVSLPDDLVDEARYAVAEGSAKSVSAYIANAMRLSPTTGKRPLREIFDEWDRELGPPNDADRDWAKAEMARASAELAAKRAARGE